MTSNLFPISSQPAAGVKHETAVFLPRAGTDILCLCAYSTQQHEAEQHAKIALFC